MTDVAASPTLLDVRDAAVTLGGRLIWQDVSLAVAADEFVAVVGPNGVGKSTLLRAILGLQRLYAGSVRASGRIGYVPQRRTFDASVRVRGVDVVRFGVDGHRWGIPLPGRRSRAAAARVEELTSLVGASAYARRPIGELSGGEQQRLLIAQALARRPELLLLDEPLDSLDLPNQQVIAALLASLTRNAGVAVVIVAHDVNPLLPYLDRVIVLGVGGVLSGTPAEVITSVGLTRLYGIPVDVVTTADGRLIVVGAS
jgi:zinc/manganese transport system ATP-binding protein